jgi:hypothetical protein
MRQQIAKAASGVVSTRRAFVTGPVLATWRLTGHIREKAANPAVAGGARDYVSTK